LRKIAQANYLCYYLKRYEIKIWNHESKIMKQSKLHYNLIFRPELEGGFTVSVPSLPGCITYGKTLEEAREMAVDAIYGYIRSLKKHREPIPSDEKSFITSLDFACSRSYAKTG
jgi:predicted RNase H-like HicB family nuclease